jgi:hypothetical protein
MASNTPRQRQYRAALDAQQHNLQSGQLTLLLTPELVLPPGQASTALPLVSRAGRWAAALTFTWPNLLGATLAPDVPVVGVVLDLPVRRLVWRAALSNDTDTAANLTTLLNEGANVPPDGRELLPDPVRPRLGVRGLVDPPNLLGTTLAPPPPPLPDGRGWTDAPLWRRMALRADAWIANLLGTTLAGTGVVDLWADLREGDIIRIISPYTAPGGESPLGW